MLCITKSKKNKNNFYILYFIYTIYILFIYCKFILRVVWFFSRQAALTKTWRNWTLSQRRCS